MNNLADRTVRGVVAGMVVAVTAATVVGFWLSYSGLHDFALRAGLSGPEGWAWPSSIDLFIAAGEAGVTIAALRHRHDWGAMAYFGLGFAASVTGNVLHVHPGQLAWARYAVAAVPPMAAMAALAALLRQVYRLAADHEAVPAMVATSEPETATERPVATARPAGIRRPVNRPQRRVATPRAEILATIAAENLTPAEVIERFGTPRTTARRHVATAVANGHS